MFVEFSAIFRIAVKETRILSGAAPFSAQTASPVINVIEPCSVKVRPFLTR